MTVGQKNTTPFSRSFVIACQMASDESPWELKSTPAKPLTCTSKKAEAIQQLAAADSIGRFRPSRLNTVNGASGNGDFDQFSPAR